MKTRQNKQQKLLLEKAILEDKLHSILKQIGFERLTEFIQNDLEDDLEYTDAEIQSELNYAQENPPGSTYGSAGTEARKLVKHLRIVKKKQQQVLKLFTDFLKLKKKVESL